CRRSAEAAWRQLGGECWVICRGVLVTSLLFVLSTVQALATSFACPWIDSTLANASRSVCPKSSLSKERLVWRDETPAKGNFLELKRTVGFESCVETKPFAVRRRVTSYKDFELEAVEINYSCKLAAHCGSTISGWAVNVIGPFENYPDRELVNCGLFSDWPDFWSMTN
ncbi:MAG: hypothetical protein AAF862_15860, partial [Pseudomonadota bacterium]